MAGRDVVDDFTSARAAVRQLVEAGADVIAIGPRLKPPLLAIVVQEAAARGVPVAADLGFTTAIEAASFGVTSIEHLSGIIEAATSGVGSQCSSSETMREAAGHRRSGSGRRFHTKRWSAWRTRCWIAA